MRMILRRLGLYALTAWVAVTVNFLLPRLMPGNPIQDLIGKLQGQVTANEIRAIRLSFGDIGSKSGLPHQYVTYLGQLFHGNLGVSITLGEPVRTILSQSVPWTIGLIGISTILSFAIGTVMGALLGWTRGSRFDSLIPTATFFQAVPYFFLATVMLLVFGSDLHWFPVLGAYSDSVNPGWSWAFITSLLRYGELPVISIVLSSIAGWMLGMRNMMITMVGEDFVLMAVAKGLPRRKVIMHAARNAVLPSIANLSLAIGLVVSGALLVELVFNYPGVGDLLLNAVLNEDYPLIQGIFLVITLTVLAANLIADFIYLALDPRTRTEAAV
jgi:peptide/nickel transport system permease protein